MNCFSVPVVLCLAVPATVVALILDQPLKHFTNPAIVAVSKRCKSPRHVSRDAWLPDRAPVSQLVISIFLRRPRPFLFVHDVHDIFASLPVRSVAFPNTDLCHRNHSLIA